MRARAELSRRLQEEDDPMMNLRNQGALRQVRVLECIPIEIKGLLAEYVEQDIRLQELELAKEKRNVEVR
jgi:hypothetical protein